MKRFALTGALVLLGACGRTNVSGRDSAQEISPSDMGDAQDGASDLPPQPPAPDDVAADRSLDLPGPDAGAAEVGADTAAPPDLAPLACPPLANDGVLNLGYIKQALFAADGRSLLVRMGAGDSDAKDEARLIQVPGVDSRVLWPNARDVEWLGPSHALITTTDNGLVAATLDGNTVYSTPASTCAHTATPDGRRVYFTSGGCERGAGPLSVLDVAAGTVKQVAASVSNSSLAVSPDSRWAAYVAGDAAADAGALYVVDATGAATAVPEVSAAVRPTFASGSVLLFQLPNGLAVGRYDLDNHDMQALVEGDVGIAGYEMTADGSVLLVAKPSSTGRSAELYRVATSGAAPVRVATDLTDYRVSSMMFRAFAFAPASNRILYSADRAGDAGWSTGISSVSLAGGPPIELSTGSLEAVMSSYADRVALVARDRTLGRSTLSVVSTSGERQFIVEVTGDVSFAGFVRRDRGLLYVQTKMDAALGNLSELGHLSFTSGKVTRLGVWTKSSLGLPNYPAGISAHEYPADPHGCYTVVDSDMDQTAARLVAIPE